MKLDLATTPLIDRPDFDDLHANGLFEPYSAYALNMNRTGYCKVNLGSAGFNSLCNEVVSQLTDFFRLDLELWRFGKGPPPRYQDGWKAIKEIRQIAANKLILSILRKLYGRSPFPFQTLNFPVGTQQSFHSDALHFHCYPHGFMCGVWIPFEDVSLESGPLFFYPGSHRFPYLSAEALCFNPGDLDGQAHPQILFQSEWARLLSGSELEKTVYLPQMSEALIWHANLLHGGDLVQSKDVTRWSQVTHYYFKDCLYTTPMYSYCHEDGGTTLRNPFDIISGASVFRSFGAIGVSPVCGRDPSPS
jgi:hypothetical protein